MMFVKLIVRLFVPDIEKQEQAESNRNCQTCYIDYSKRAVFAQVAKSCFEMVAQHKAGFG